MDFLRVFVFFAVTIGHLLLTPYWLKRIWSDSFSSAEELLFDSLVFGFGSLQAALHVLACSVGISLSAGALSLVGINVALYLSTRRLTRSTAKQLVAAPEAPPARSGRKARRESRAQPPTSASGGWWTGLLRIPVATLAGGVMMVALVLSWLVHSPQSLQILGIDSRNYHVPFAVNYGHGLNIFGLLATPHPYPVGASILGAWFFQAFSDPLLLDLVNLLPSLLLFASLVYLFRLLTEESGLEWATVIFLLLLTGKMFRASMFISADMLYTAGFTAVFTQLCRMWMQAKVDARDWLAWSLATGLLLSSKIQGPMSAGLMFVSFGAAAGLRRLIARRQWMHAEWPLPCLAAGALLLLASGGIWLVRNWLYFGSPMAPAGLTMFGVKIFSGLEAYNDWLSIAKDMRDVPHYNLLQRFLVRSKEWVGVWPAFVSLGLAVLPCDVVYQLRTQRRLSVVVQRKLFALLFFIVLFIAHAYILIRTEGTSIEILNGQTTRYIMPFFALYPLLAYALFFSDSFRWVQRLRLQWVVLLPGLVYLFMRYNTLTEMPVEWNRTYGRDDLLDYRLLPLALIALIPWCVPRGAARRLAQSVVLGIGALAFVAFVQMCVTSREVVMAAARQRFEQELTGFQRGLRVLPHRAALLRVVEDQRAHGLQCAHSRFFVMSRFDFPLELQDPAFSNVVFDMQGNNRMSAALLEASGPGHGRCDYIVAAFRPSTEGNPQIPAIDEREIPVLLSVQGSIEAVGDAGNYRVYRVRRG